MKYILVAQQVYFLSESLANMRKQEGGPTVQALTGSIHLQTPKLTKKSAIGTNHFITICHQPLDFSSHYFAEQLTFQAGKQQCRRSQNHSCFKAGCRETHSSLSKGCNLLVENYRYGILQHRPPHQLSMCYGVHTIQNSTRLILFLMRPTKGTVSTWIQITFK